MNRNKSIRITALLLLLAMLCPAFLACNEDKAEEAETTESALRDEYLDTMLPTDTYDGETFGIIGGEHTKMMPGEEETSEPVHDALFRRNAKIEERYDVDFVYTQTVGGDDPTDGNGTNQKLETAVLANDKIYDLVYGSFITCGAYFVNNGLIMSTDNIPHLNLGERWWSQDCMGQLTVNNKTLFLTGMIAYDYCTDGSCLFFNKNITENKGLDNHFEDVRSYRWTLDKMQENMKAAAHDDNGDTIMDVNDTWGYVGSNTSGFAFAYSNGIRLVEYDEDDTPSIIQTPSDEIYTKVDKICSILSNRRYSANRSIPEYAATQDSFVNGKALYWMGACQNGATVLRPADFYDFGIIPFPMWNEEQAAYYTWADSWGGGGIYFPIINEKEEMTGVLVEALAYQSSVESGYYYAVLEKFIKGKGTYDYDSEEMVDLILASKLYDLGNYFYWGISYVVNDCCQDEWSFSGAPSGSSLSSLWAGRVRSAQQACKQTVRAWNRID